MPAKGGGRLLRFGSKDICTTSAVTARQLEYRPRPLVAIEAVSRSGRTNPRTRLVRARLVQIHAVGVVSHRRRPVREDSEDLHLSGQHVERLVHVTVLLDRCARRVEVVVEARLRCTLAQVGSLEGPRYDVEAHALEILRQLRGHDAAAAIDREERRHRRGDDPHLGLPEIHEELQLILLLLELLAVPLIVLILMNDLPIRLGARGDLSDIFFGPFNHWTVLYLPLPTIAVMGCLLGITGVYRQLRIAPRDRPADDDSRRRGVLTNLVLALPFFMAVWIVIAMIFVGWIPEVV